MATVHSPPRESERYTPAQIRQWRDDLARIRAVCRRKRIIGRADPLLEVCCAALERRLVQMQEAPR